MILDIAILAAGKGSRMRSKLPKVLHKVAGIPMIQHVLNAAKKLPDARLHLIVGHEGEKVSAACQKFSANIVWQNDLRGTGDALRRVAPYLQDKGSTLTLYGDVPFIKASTLETMIALSSSNTLVLLTINLDYPTDYGRVVRNEQGRVMAIVEQRDASAEECSVNEVNTGILLAPNEYLHKWLASLKNNNAQGEYYLTDIIAVAVRDGVDIITVHPENETEVAGVNDRIQLAVLEKEWQSQQAIELMKNGATLLDPARIDVRGELTIGQDVIIDINCIFEGCVVLEDNVEVGANCYLKNCIIGNGTIIKSYTLIEDSMVGEQCDIGPFARIRPGTQLACKAKIGNFVETKKAIIGEGSKANHLSYIGDIEMGAGVNVGAGTITCNYDGVNKFPTKVADNVFIGSNSSLVAPLEIGEGATIAAGSTVTRNVEAHQLVLARSRQIQKDNWPNPVKKT